MAACKVSLTPGCLATVGIAMFTTNLLSNLNSSCMTKCERAISTDNYSSWCVEDSHDSLSYGRGIVSDVLLAERLTSKDPVCVFSFSLGGFTQC